MKPSPPRSISDTSPSMCGGGVQRYLQRLSSSLGGCSLYPRRCGQQLQSSINSGLSFLRLPVCELRRSYHVLRRWGVPCSVYMRNLLTFLPRLPILDAPLPKVGESFEERGTCNAEKFFVRPLVSCLSFWLSLSRTSLREQAQESSRQLVYFGSQLNQAENLQTVCDTPRGGFHNIHLNTSCDKSLTSGGFIVSKLRLVSTHSRRRYWDLHVPVYNNYLSDGIVNHNSGKSHFFAGLLVERHLLHKGMRSVCIREVQKTLKESAKRLIDDKIQEFGLAGQGFRSLHDRIETPGGGIITFQGMQDSTAESIKSLEGFGTAWVEEAQTMSARSLQLLRPTIRAEGSELWFSWNPRRKTDPVDVLLRGKKMTGAVVVRSNWDNNPWLPDVLNQERLDDLENNPDSYEHVWNGGYITAQDGAYYAKVLAKARSEGRIGKVPRDKLMAVHAFFDIGGTGAKADACSIWLVQFIDKEIRVINYYEAVGQELSEHVGWLRRNDYEDAKIYLPHDGVKHDSVFRVTYESALVQAGFFVTILKNAGAGAANQRVEAVRRIFPMIWMDEKNCEGGLEAIGWYHEKKDDARGIGLGPDHDWSSHGADSFGYMALEAEKIQHERTVRSAPAQAQSFNVFG